MSWSAYDFNWWMNSTHANAPYWYKSSGDKPGSATPFWTDFVASFGPATAAADYSTSTYWMIVPTIKWLSEKGKLDNPIPSGESQYISCDIRRPYCFLPKLQQPINEESGFLSEISTIGTGFNRMMRTVAGAASSNTPGAEGLNCSFNLSECIDFFVNDYYSAPFVCMVSTMNSYGALDPDGDLNEVLYSTQVRPLDCVSWAELYSEGTTGVGPAQTPTDEQEEAKYLPKPISTVSMADIEGMIGTPTAPFIIPLTYKLEAFPDIKADLKSRYKIPAVIEGQRDLYVKQRIEAYTNLLRETLLIPKEYRVRKQNAPDFANQNISGFPSMSSADSSPNPSTSGGSY